MNDYNWLRVRILQYLMFKADKLSENAKAGITKLKTNKSLSSSEYVDIYTAILKSEMLEEVYRDILNLF